MALSKKRLPSHIKQPNALNLANLLPVRSKFIGFLAQDQVYRSIRATMAFAN